MIKAVIFDMFETLITESGHEKYSRSCICNDLKIDKQAFTDIWSGLEVERTTGIISFEDVLRLIMEKLECGLEDAYEMVIKKRYETKAECFQYLHPALIPTLDSLKNQNIKIGLISNCFSEEVQVIKNSCLYHYFDAAILSYEVGAKKPDRRIYEICLEKLGVLPEECLYLGDGGSSELVGARDAGMCAIQAGWYIIKYRDDWQKEGFDSFDSPNMILSYI